MQTRQQKKIVIEDLQQKLMQAKGVLFLSLKKLSTDKFLKLKQEIKNTGGLVRVVKKTLLTIAKPHLPTETITGPFALVVDSSSDLTSLSVLGKYKDEFKLEIFGGQLEEHSLAQSEIWTIAKLPPKPIMIGQVLGILKGQLYGFSFMLQSPLLKLHSVLKQINLKKSATS